MNPFTRYLTQKLRHRDLLRFVQKWDQVESLVVRTYRGEGILKEDAKNWYKLRKQLQKEYPRWKEKLKPFWLRAKVKGSAEIVDPFEYILQSLEPVDFRENWDAMRVLPAAREALNRLIIELQNNGQ